ncbi:hypothetical protein V8E36_004516 [Tilletia maclaganii]
MLPAYFSPLHSFLGGLILSSSVSALLSQTGTVLGISGFFHASIRSLLIDAPRQLHRQLFSSASSSSGAGGAGDATTQRSDSTAKSTARFFTLGLLSSGLLLAAGRRSFKGKLGIQLFDDALTAGNHLDAFKGSGSYSPLLTFFLGVLLPGLLVGAGTKLGSGCTSGHFLCGLSRLSPRSIAATTTFFSVAVLTNLLQPLASFLPYSPPPTPRNDPTQQAPKTPDILLLLAFQIPALVYGLIVPYVIAPPPKPSQPTYFSQSPEARAERTHSHEQAARITSFSTGLHFGLGLALSGMLRPSKVIVFLNLSPSHWERGRWDPSLAMVALGGIVPASLTYFTYIVPKVQAQRRRRRVAGKQVTYGAVVDQDGPQAPARREEVDPTAPLLSAAAPLWRVPVSEWSSWAATRIDGRLLLGASLFGVGWGLSGLCPGPVLVSLGANAVSPPATAFAEARPGSNWDLLTQPGTAGSLLPTALFTASMALGGLLV